MELAKQIIDHHFIDKAIQPERYEEMLSYIEVIN